MPTTGFLFDQSKTSPLILFAHCGVIFYEVFFLSRVQLMRVGAIAQLVSAPAYGR